MLERFKKDNLVTGIMIGWFSISLDYLVIFGVNKILVYFGSGFIINNKLIAILILTTNIILFRLMIVNWKRIQNGKGILISILLAVFVYICWNNIFHQL